jgi:hypothetical protein
MHLYKVGGLYNPARRTWPETPLLLVPMNQAAELVLFMRRPTAGEIQAVRTGRADFAWVKADDFGVLAYRFTPGIPWSDTPYNPHRDVRPDGHTPGIAPGDGHLLVQIILVDAATGIIAAMRQLTFPPRFVAAMRDDIDRLLDKPFSETAYLRGVEALYARYPRPEHMVRDRAVANCQGGAGDTAAGTRGRG